MSTAWAVTLVVGVSLGLLALVVAIIHSLAADEIRAWLPYLSRRLARSAARQLPAGSRARCEADWLAELAAWEDRPLSALAKAVHTRWKVKAIRESLGGVQLKGERAKRAFDWLSAMGFLVLYAPLLLAAAVAIKLDSRGPVFVRQPRIGRSGKSFRLIKFRSMYVDAGPRTEVFSIHGDPRITRVGRIIRRFSLDELPQFFNILKGDMSLVGPRPLPPELPTSRSN